MGILDRFRPSQPATTPRGGSGRGNTGGYVREDDLNTKLTGRQGLRVFDLMYRSDPDVRRIVVMLANPIAGATWSVEPYGGPEADDAAKRHAEFVEWALFDRLYPSWTAHLHEALRVTLRSGFAPFEQVWQAETWEGRTVLALDALDLRLPSSVWAWEQENGRLTSITQNTGDGGEVVLPAQDLAYYRLGAEGDNWKGESILRPAYKAWKFKDALELIDSIGHERHHVGTPIAYPPASATDDDRTEIANALAGLRANSQGYIVVPGPKAGAGADDGWTIEILTPGGAGGGPSITDSLSYHRDAISAVIVGEFMRLGQSGVGARATADVQQDPFLAYCEAIAGLLIEDTINLQVVPRLVGLNFPPAEVKGLPQVRASLIDATTLSELADYVQKLGAAEALHPDLPLEDYLRERASLPPADEEARSAREEMAQAARDALAAGAPASPDEAAGQQPDAKAPPAAQQAPQQPPDAAGKAEPPPKGEQAATLALAAARPDRQLASAQHDAVQRVATQHLTAVLDGARGDVEQGAAAAVTALAARLALDPSKPAPTKPDPGIVRAAADALGRAYDAGHRSVTAELALERATRAAAAKPEADASAMLDANHGMTVALAGDNEGTRLRALAEVIAHRTTSAVWAAIRRAAALGAAPEQLPGMGAQAGLAAARSEAQQAASQALSLGRQAAAAADGGVEGVIYTAIMDSATCDACAEADTGDVVPLDSPDRIEPPNPDCEGGGRCRCIEVFVLAPEA